MTTLTQKTFRLFFLLLLTNVVGYLGSFAMSEDSMNWYQSLVQAPLTPPAIVFVLIWPILYALMSISAFLVWGKVSPRYFCLQLIANGLWPIAFFYFREPLMALLILLVMIVFIILTIKDFAKFSKPAGWLLVPLLVWSVFALYLNGFIVLMN